MNIEQLKKDRVNGVILCRDTYTKLIEAALVMIAALAVIESETYKMIGPDSELAGKTLKHVEKL